MLGSGHHRDGTRDILCTPRVARGRRRLIRRPRLRRAQPRWHRARRSSSPSVADVRLATMRDGRGSPRRRSTPSRPDAETDTRKRVGEVQGRRQGDDRRGCFARVMRGDDALNDSDPVALDPHREAAVACGGSGRLLESGNAAAAAARVLSDTGSLQPYSKRPANPEASPSRRLPVECRRL